MGALSGLRSGESSPVARGLVVGIHVAVLLAGVFGTVYAKQSVRFASVEMTTTVSDDTVYLPSHRVLRMSSLGYGPFWSDMLFVRTHAYFLKHMYSDRIFSWLDPYVEAVIALDPDSQDIYNWAATIVRFGQMIDEDVVNRSNGFAEAGLERFPDDPRLYAHLGFNKYFELRPMRMDREEALRVEIEAETDTDVRREKVARLTEVKAERYALEKEALIDYSMAAMLPHSTIDPVFLATLYVKHDEAGAAAKAIASLYGAASAADQEQLLFRLQLMGQDELAAQLSAAKEKHTEDMPYVPAGLYSLLLPEDELRVPERWDSAGAVFDQALRAIGDKHE